VNNNIRNVVKISSARWRSYFFFLQGGKSENSEPVQITFSAQKKEKRTSQVVEVILSSFLKCYQQTDSIKNIKPLQEGLYKKTCELFTVLM
jgi:hypothetical protein